MHRTCFVVYVCFIYSNFLSALKMKSTKPLDIGLALKSLACFSFSSHAIGVLYSYTSNNFHTCMFGCSSVGLLRSQPMDFFRQQISGGIRASAGARVRRSSDSCSEGG